MRGCIISAVVLLVMWCAQFTGAVAAPISLAPTSPAAADYRPVGINGPDNPLHLTVSQQLHINARKLKFQRDATKLLADTKMPAKLQAMKMDALEKDARADILAMLNPKQYAAIQTQEQAADAHAAAQVDAIKQREVLDKTYLHEKSDLMNSLSPTQDKQLIALEESTKAKVRQLQANTRLPKTLQQSKLAAIVAAYQMRRNAIFTPAQRQIIATMDNIARQAAALEAHGQR